MELDGETVYACTARLEPREMRLAPLSEQAAGARSRHRDCAARRALCCKGEIDDAERKPVAFGDMRDWMKALKRRGELREIDAEVDWNVELGTITRMAQGPGTGPALLFSTTSRTTTRTTPAAARFSPAGLAAIAASP